MEYIFEPTYYNSCQYDHQIFKQERRLHPNNKSDDDKTNPNQVLNVQQLYHKITHHLQCVTNNVTIQRRKFKCMLPHYLLVDTESHDYFVIIQMILALSIKIPIMLKHPRHVYWNNYIYKSRGRNNRFQCQHCEEVIEFDSINNCILIKEKVEHKKSQCVNQRFKYDLIYKLLIDELKENIFLEPFIESISPHKHYNRVITRYKYKFPLMDLSQFPPFEAIKSNLYKQKNNTQTLTSFNITDFFNNKFGNIVKKYCSSPSMQNNFKSNTVIWINQNNFLFTRISLLHIFFLALAIGGDGTFNIVPFFRKLNGGKTKLHEQVFKIYAFFRYQTKNGKFRIIAYLIGVALLENRDTETYKWMYQQIFDWGQKHDYIVDCNIQQYICDFEEAQRKGFRYIFEEEYSIQISGEEFHFKQCLHGNVRHKQLTKYYAQKKDSKSYNRIFRIHIEALYNLCHIKPITVKSMATKITQSLWFYVKQHFRCKYGIKSTLQFIIYFLVGWCECTKEDVIKILNCKGKQITFVRDRHPRKIENINAWNINGKPISNSNAIEVNNKHHRMKLGYYPTIDDFIIKYLDIFDETINLWKYHQSVKILPNHFESKALRKKKKLLEKHKNDCMNFEQYKIFSAQLTKIKYENNCKDIKHLFANHDQKQDETVDMNESNFNDVIKVPNSIAIAKEKYLDIDTTVDKNDEDYIAPKIFQQTNSNDNLNTNISKRQKRSCVIKLQQANFSAYKEFDSDDEVEPEWIQQMSGKNNFEKNKKPNYQYI